jgi:hypothetical protein
MKSDLIPSFPNAVKRTFFIEREGWDANIKVDYDDNKNRISVKRIREASLFIKKKKIEVIRVKVSRTGKGYHLRIWLNKPIGPYTTLKIQSILGDDPERQRFNLIRVRKKMNGWNVLFTEKWRGKTIVWIDEFDAAKTRLVWRKIMKESDKDGLTEIIEEEFKNGL